MRCRTGVPYLPPGEQGGDGVGIEHAPRRGPNCRGCDLDQLLLFQGHTLTVEVQNRVEAQLAEQPVIVVAIDLQRGQAPGEIEDLQIAVTVAEVALPGSQ